MGAVQAARHTAPLGEIGTLVWAGPLEGKDPVAIVHDKKTLPVDRDWNNRAGPERCQGANANPGHFPAARMVRVG